MTIQRSGYKTDSPLANIGLGMMDGMDSSLWSYAFASIIFSGALTNFVPLGAVIILFGWAVISIFMIVTSPYKLHMVSIDEQAVVIIGSIGTLLIADLGTEASSAKGLATLLAVMSITSITVALSFYLAGRFHFLRLLELLPYPVICGFMAGIGWLLLDAGVSVAIDVPITFDLWQTIIQDNNALKLILPMLGGAGLIIFANKCDKAWALPVASVSIITSFYGVASFMGASKEDLLNEGWLYSFDVGNLGPIDILSTLSFSHIDFGFISSVIPEILTIVFLVMLSASMNLTTMSAINQHVEINTSDEMKNLSGGNLLCAAIGSPPGYSDVTSSSIYEGFGASCRLMPIASSLVCIGVAFAGSWLIGLVPKVLIGSTIFLFAFQLFYDWMYENVRSFSPLDYVIVCTILLTVIAFGFMEGIFVGVMLTALLFVLRYSMISAIQGQYSLCDHRSSVERSTSCNTVLNRHGTEAIVLTLRGFLFFGTANAIRDTIRDQIKDQNYSTLLIDLRRVTGIDISALNIFVQIKQSCEVANIQTLYSCTEKETEDKLVSLEAASIQDGKVLIFPETDFAIECMEEILLKKYDYETTHGAIENHLMDILENAEKAHILASLMERKDLGVGDTLFEQGDYDTGFFMLESGSMTALINTGNGTSKRVKKFSAGSVIGEMSNYTTERKRTASVVVDEPSVIYHLDPARIDLADTSKAEAIAAVHELVARTLGSRINFMNRRLMLELV